MKRAISHLAIILFLLQVAVAHAGTTNDASFGRTWKNTDQSVAAKGNYLLATGGNVFVDTDGEVKTLLLAELSDADQEYVQGKQEQLAELQTRFKTDPSPSRHGNRARGGGQAGSLVNTNEQQVQTTELSAMNLSLHTNDLYPLALSFFVLVLGLDLLFILSLVIKAGRRPHNVFGQVGLILLLGFSVFACSQGTPDAADAYSSTEAFAEEFQLYTQNQTAFFDLFEKACN